MISRGVKNCPPVVPLLAHLQEQPFIDLGKGEDVGVVVGAEADVVDLVQHIKQIALGVDARAVNARHDLAGPLALAFGLSREIDHSMFAEWLRIGPGRKKKLHTLPHRHGERSGRRQSEDIGEMLPGALCGDQIPVVNGQKVVVLGCRSKGLAGDTSGLHPTWIDLTIQKGRGSHGVRRALIQDR